MLEVKQDTACRVNLCLQILQHGGLINDENEMYPRSNACSKIRPFSLFCIINTIVFNCSVFTQRSAYNRVADSRVSLVW